MSLRSGCPVVSRSEDSEKRCVHRQYSIRKRAVQPEYGVFVGTLDSCLMPVGDVLKIHSWRVLSGPDTTSYNLSSRLTPRAVRDIIGAVCPSRRSHCPEAGARDSAALAVGGIWSKPQEIIF